MDDSKVQAKALPPIDLIEPDDDLPAPRRSRGRVMIEGFGAVPHLARLVYRLLRDDRVPRRPKVLLGAAGVYFASPIDVIPEAFFPVIGRVDDVLVLAFALDRLLDSVDPEVVAEHWDGDGDVLDVVGALLAWAGELLPRPVRRILAR